MPSRRSRSGIASPGPKLATGILVIYADDESFTFMTPEGHMFAGMITFSAEEDARGHPRRINILIRPNDPIYELGWPVIVARTPSGWQPSPTWRLTTGWRTPTVTEATICVDRKRMWSNWRNVRHNSGIRSGIHIVTTPIRMLRPQRSSG